MQNKIIVEYSRQWNEYRVCPFIDNSCRIENIYFTDDKQDAFDTQKAMQKEYREKHNIELTIIEKIQYKERSC